MPVTIRSLGIDRLSIDEQIALMGEIWDHLIASGAHPQLSKSQLQELRRRVAEDDGEPENLVPWEEVKAQALQPAPW